MKLNKYFFILGTNPTLSVAELSAVFGLNNKEAEIPTGRLESKNAFVLDTDITINARELIKHLGGTIKIGEIYAQVQAKDENKILEEIKNIISPGESKFNFGISAYGMKKSFTKPLAMKLKSSLKEKNISSRWVTSKEQTLSSVVVEQNKLTTTGAEIVLISSPLLARRGAGGEGEVLIGKTLSVQPFKALSDRDYGRPARDDASGMLPPKLAQIMINLSAPPSPLVGGGLPVSLSASRGGGVRENLSLLDPFCGSGTILTEALLLEFKNIIGSDLSEKAVSDTKQNIEWIVRRYNITSSQYEIFQSDVAMLAKHLNPESIDAIVTEPYLGPQRGKYNVSQAVSELSELYSNALAEFASILKPESKVVMVWPIYRERGNNFHILPELDKFKIINPIPENLRNNKVIKLTKRNTIIYGRENQRVWREIVVLQ